MPGDEEAKGAACEIYMKPCLYTVLHLPRVGRQYSQRVTFSLRHSRPAN